MLVNNAGMRLYHSVVDATEQSWDAILGVNVKSYAFCAKAAIPEMRGAAGGAIVNVALNRPGTPREVAHCILFLASDDAFYVTGTVLFVDGGQSAI